MSKTRTALSLLLILVIGVALRVLVHKLEPEPKVEPEPEPACIGALIRVGVKLIEKDTELGVVIHRKPVFACIDDASILEYKEPEDQST